MQPYWSQRRVCVTGGAGFLGRALCAHLKQQKASTLIIPRREQYDLTHADAVTRLFDDARPDVVIHLAAEVGGIGANRDHPGRFFYANLIMGLHLIEEARRRGLEKFVQVGTVCAYPTHCPLPFREEDLWNGFPEETNAPYGVAKRALQVMLEAYRAEYGFNGLYLIPVNLYGPHDDFDLHTSHVIPALIRKFCTAADTGADTVACWGTGTATREFLYVDDAAEAIVLAARVHDNPQPINLGTGEEISIADLAARIARLTGFTGTITWDAAQPDGQPRRRLDTTRAANLLGWRAQVSLDEGLRRTIAWWRLNMPTLREGMPPAAGDQR
ncbi:MAG TPA: GDP-L-fucose synthase [Phycisphaerae bacterium]|nr:GDP-L-fucose synthase [Phycisphaerae bacterium]HNU45090.1 GDP-L-fucose synthase [Phycisphaerae bacterium]